LRRLPKNLRLKVILTLANIAETKLAELESL